MSIELEYLISDHHKTYMARGHVDLIAMRRAVEAEREHQPDFHNWKGPQHLWYRAIPKPGYTAWYMEAQPNARGAFPATVMTLDW